MPLDSGQPAQINIPEQFGSPINGFDLGHPSALYSVDGQFVTDSELKAILALMEAMKSSESGETKNDEPILIGFTNEGKVEVIDSELKGYLLNKQCPFDGAYMPDFAIQFPPSKDMPSLVLCVYPNGELLPGQLVSNYDGEGRVITFVPDGYVLVISQLHKYLQQHFPDAFDDSNLSIPSFTNIIADEINLIPDPSGEPNFYLPSGTPLEILYRQMMLNITNTNGSTLDSANQMNIKQFLYYLQQALKPAQEVGLESINITTNVPSSYSRAERQEVAGNLTLPILAIAIISGAIGLAVRQIEKYRAKSQPSGDAS